MLHKLVYQQLYLILIWFSGWQQQYGNDPYQILESRGFNLDDELKKRVRGSEAAMWSEQVYNYKKSLSIKM